MKLINDLDQNLENNPDVLKNLLLIHFPIFPLNIRYIEKIFEIIKEKITYMNGLY